MREVKQINIKVVVAENISKETDKETERHLDFSALMDLREKEY